MEYFDPLNWFWIVGGDETRAWSSAASAYVPQWQTSSVTRIASEDELSDVLAVYGLKGPVVIVPKSVALYQGRAALIEAGLFDQVKTTVISLGEGSLAYQAFEYANHWYRDSAFIAQLAGSLGLASEQIDALFIAAADL